MRPALLGCPAGHYLQRRVPGRPCSIVFLADGRGAAIVGYNEIHVQGGSRAEPYRYTGAVTVADPGNAPAIERAVQALVVALGLVGLCGLDFMLDEEGRYWVLEINPRPTGTFELYDELDEQGPCLLARHLAACGGRLPRTARREAGSVAAQEILFATGTVAVPGAIRWPDWARDRPAAGTVMRAGDPICTLHARGLERKAVDRLMEERRALIAAALGWPLAA